MATCSIADLRSVINERVLALVAIVGLAVLVTPASAAVSEDVYTGRASALLPASIDWYPPLDAASASSSSLTAGPRRGLVALAGRDFVAGSECSSRCARAQLRVLVFRTAAQARLHWKAACPGCSYGRDQDGWSFWRGPRTDPKIIGLCRNLVLAARGDNWGDGRYAREAVGSMIETAEAGGMTSCDPILQSPLPNVFARGIARNPRKAVAAGSISQPDVITLRIRSGGFGDFYVEWTLTCTNGKRTETTSDDGLTRLPLTLSLPMGLPNPSKCSASASARAYVEAGHAPPGGSVVVELQRG